MSAGAPPSTPWTSSAATPPCGKRQSSRRLTQRQHEGGEAQVDVLEADGGGLRRGGVAGAHGGGGVVEPVQVDPGSARDVVLGVGQVDEPVHAVEPHVDLGHGAALTAHAQAADVHDVAADLELALHLLQR